MSVAWAASAATPLRPAGDAELERLYAEYSTKVHGYCRRQLGGRVEAEDATQTVFLHALRALRSGVVPELESAWLFAIAHNVCRTYWRGAARRRRSEDQQDPHVLEQFVAQRETEHDELFGLDDALSRIPETQRRAILLREWHGLSYREIAEKLGTSAAAVEMLLFRARRSLAAQLRGERPTLRAKAVGGLGDLLTFLKLLLGGSSAALKIVAGVAAVAALTAGGEELRHRDAATGTQAAAAHAARAPAVQQAADVRHAVPSASSRRSPHASGTQSDPPASRAHRAPVTAGPPAVAEGPPSATEPPSPPPPAAAEPPAARPSSGGEPPPTASPPASDGSPAPSSPQAPAPTLPAPLPQLPETPPLPQAPTLPAVPGLPPISAVPDVPALPEPAELPSAPDVPIPAPSLP